MTHTKTEAPERGGFGIYLDTVVLLANGWPKHTSKALTGLVEVAAAAGLKLLVPAVCRFEMRRQWEARLQKERQETTRAYEKFVQKQRELRRYDWPAPPSLSLPDAEEQMRIYDRLEQDRFEQSEYVEVPLLTATLSELIQRSAEHRPPFPRADDEGFRDGVIALSIAEHATKSNVRAIVVTSDDRLGNSWTWKTLLPDVLLVKLDDFGFKQITDALKDSPPLAIRRDEVNKVQEVREQLLTEHRRMLSVLRSAMEAQADALEKFIQANLEVAPGSVVQYPRRLVSVSSVKVGDIQSVWTQEPLLTLEERGTHEIVAMIAVTLNLRVEGQTIHLQRPVRIGETVSPPSTFPVTHVRNHAERGVVTVTLNTEVGDEGGILGLTFLSVTFGDPGSQIVELLARREMEAKGFVFTDPSVDDMATPSGEPY